MTLKDQLATLVNLQALDSEIYHLTVEKEAKPQEIKELENIFEAKKQNLAALEKKSLDCAKQKKDKELDLGTKEESVKKLQSQLFALKTNKEYQTMLQQIQDVKADISVIEDGILSVMDEIEKIKTEIETEKNRLKAEEQIFLADKKKVDDRVKEINDRLAQLDASRKQLTPSVEAKLLAQYERILKSRDGLAICLVKHDSCLGCHMHMPPQVINMIKMYDKIVTCETCNRMLYIDE